METRGASTTTVPSQLAIAALVVGAVGVLLPCCPLVPTVAVILGWVARRRIRLDASLSGARMALIAIVLGAVGLVGQGLLFDWFSNRFREEVETRSERIAADLMTTATLDSEAPVPSSWSAVAGPEGRSLRSLGRTARGRYGAFLGLSVVDWTYAGDVGSPDLTAAVIWRFEQRELTGSVRMLLRPSTNLADPYPAPEPLEVVIADERLGDLRLGTPDAEPSSEPVPEPR